VSLKLPEIGVRAEHGVAAERLDRADFVMQMRQQGFPIYRCISSSRPLNASTLGCNFERMC